MATQLNAEAGFHAVTSDPRELDAVIRAAQRSWSEFPYYTFRFGDRGMRFGASDGAWLVTLCRGTIARAHEQVLWLGGVLSSRGMPQILLERHLEILHEELGGREYAVLKRCAREMRRLRLSMIPEGRFAELADEFESQTAAVAPFRGMGLLLVSAVADEKLGIEHAVDGIRTWATAEQRFTNEWVKAVDMTIKQARDQRPTGK